MSSIPVNEFSCQVPLLLAIDVRGHRQWTLAFVVIGSNSIFIYMFPALYQVKVNTA